MRLKSLNSKSFEEMLKSGNELNVVFFSRKDCLVCQEVIPVLRELSKKYAEQCGFYRVNVEREKKLFQRFSLQGVPQVLLFKNGIYRGKKAGLVEPEELAEMIEGIL